MKTKIRHVLTFIVAAVIIQLSILLFLTPDGIELLFPLRVRIASEKVKADSNTYAVYYDMRSEIADADVIVIGVDYNADETYSTLGHFTRFVKQYNNVSDVYLNLDSLQLSIVNILFKQTDESRYENLLQRLEDDGGLSEKYCSYISELFFVNSTVSPNRKFNIVSYSAENVAADATDADSTNAEVSLTQKIAALSYGAERSIFCAVDSRLLEYTNDFRDELNEMLPDKKIVYIQSHYTESCTSPETHTIYTFPFAGENQGYFVSGRKLSGFYSYYNWAAGLFGAGKAEEDRLDTRYTEFFFVISGEREYTSAE